MEEVLRLAAQHVSDVHQVEVIPEVGDLTKDGSIELGDLIFLLNYLFKSGPVPDPLSVGDVNCDGGVELSDVVFLLNYLFRSGPAPCTP